MPTYKNLSNTFLTVNNVLFEPYQTKTTDKILSDANLQLISDEPYYNPLLADSTISVGASATYDYIPESSSSIRINPVSGDSILYINNILNLPAIILTEIVTLDNGGRIEKLILEGVTDAEINLKEYK